MTSAKKATVHVVEDTMLLDYATALVAQRDAAEASAIEAGAMWGLIESWAIESQEQYSTCGALLREVKGKVKFLDDERKVSVSPLNDEVKRINDWYRPALDKLKLISEHAAKLMGEYSLRQKQEEQRLLVEAAQIARAVLSSDPNAASMAVTATLVQQAADTAAPKLAGVSERPVWTFSIIDAAALVRAHPELSMPDMRAVAAWVKEHGDRNVPVGVEVKNNVRFTVRS